MATLREILAERVVGPARRTADAVMGRLRSALRPAPKPPLAPREGLPARPTVPTRPTVPVRPAPPLAPIPSVPPVSAVQPLPPRVSPAEAGPSRPTPTRPQAPARPLPGEPSRAAVDPARASPGELLQELSTIQAATASLVERLRELGYLDAAQAILGTTAPTTPTAPPAAPPPPSQPPPPPEPPPEPEPEEPEPQEPEKEGPRYLLNGPAIRIPFFPPEEAFAQFDRMWDRVAIGGPRDPDDPTRGTAGAALYGADAIARGSAMDPGKRIPPSALSSRSAFLGWAEKHGYREGLSIVVDGLLAPPGRSIGPMSPRDLPASKARQESLRNDRERRVVYWTVPTDEKKT